MATTTQEKFARSQRKRDSFFDAYLNGNKMTAHAIVSAMTKYEIYQLCMDTSNRFETNIETGTSFEHARCHTFIQNVLTGDS